MRTITNPNGLGANFIVRYPDYICSAYDEELFVEIINPSAANGSIIEIKYRLSSKTGADIITTASVVMWGGVGRFYFDNIFFSDFTKACIRMYLHIQGWTTTFLLYPKKSIGDIQEVAPILLPFWNGKNVFSSPVAMDVYKSTINGNVKVTMPAHTKNKIINVDSIFISGQGAYTEQYTDEYMIPSSGYYNLNRKVCPDHVYFEWIDDDGLWRSWYFKLQETKINSKGASKNIITNISASGNERRLLVDQKQNTVSKLFSSGHEVKEVLNILNSIKSSSFVFMGENLERVNVKSEDTTDINKIDEFIFTVTETSKIAM